MAWAHSQKHSWGRYSPGGTHIGRHPTPSFPLEGEQCRAFCHPIFFMGDEFRPLLKMKLKMKLKLKIIQEVLGSGSPPPSPSLPADKPRHGWNTGIRESSLLSYTLVAKPWNEVEGVGEECEGLSRTHHLSQLQGSSNSAYPDYPDYTDYPSIICCLRKNYALKSSDYPDYPDYWILAGSRFRGMCCCFRNSHCFLDFHNFLGWHRGLGLSYRKRRVRKILPLSELDPI